MPDKKTLERAQEDASDPYQLGRDLPSKFLPLIASQPARLRSMHQVSQLNVGIYLLPRQQ